MEPQFLVNVLFAISGAFGGWILNSLSKAIIRIEDRLSEIPMQYVSKDDYKADIGEIKSMLARIFDKLDNKVDK